MLQKVDNGRGNAGVRNCCVRGIPQGLDGLPDEVYIFMSNWFESFLADVYWNWQENQRNPTVVCREAVTLLRKGPNKRDMIKKFRYITLLNVELKVLAKLLFKWLALVVYTLVDRAQMWIIQSRTIHHNLHHMGYTIEGWVTTKWIWMGTWCI